MVEGQFNFYKNYNVDSNGRIYNNITKKILKTWKDNKGYEVIRLSRKYFKIHRLVAKAFIPNPNNLPQVNHIDGNKQNNNVENLEWCTQSYNIRHADLIGLRKMPKGENASNAKLTQKDVDYIRTNYIPRDKTYGAIALAKKYHIDRSSITKIMSHKTFKESENNV